MSQGRGSSRARVGVLLAMTAGLVAAGAWAQLPPYFEVRGVPGAGPEARHVRISVVNRDSRPRSARAGVDLERWEGGRWVRQSAAGLLLRTACGGAPLPSCVTLAAGSTTLTEPWLGTFGDAQCECTRCGPAPAGRYRFVAYSCDGAPYQGEPFELPPARP